MFNAISFSGYKSYPVDKEVEIPKLEYISLFIGKNNCGKSSVLDVIGAATQTRYYRQLNSKPGQVKLGYRINEDVIKRVSQRYAHSYMARNAEHAMKKHVGELVWVWNDVHSGYSADSIRFEQRYDQKLNEYIREDNASWKEYAESADMDARKEKRFRKIAAERIIVPEKASSSITLLPDGSGATNVIRNIINNQKHDENLIEVVLLNALNKIMGNDAQFESIRVQEIGPSNDAGEVLWEVYLQEKGSTRFPLSQSGSGLKTIILVLLNLLVLPEIDKDHPYIYAFEELENNLHPALQRRLYDYIYDYATSNKRYIFLTTHSHVAINMFFGKEHTALYHVTKEDQVSDVKAIENYLDKAEILDDLDVKASDLLQANGIIWVEGPSDRIYIKRWLEVFGGDDIQEGRDYQFAYYGGRLLSHYSAEEDAKELINILLINRNSAIVMDSDKRNRSAPINDTKKRVAKEFEDKKLFSWITKGKEIENYLSVSAINSAFSLDLQEQCPQYRLFPEYIKDHYSNFSNKKVVFATQIRDSIDTTPVLDLEERIKKLYQVVKAWNK